jgi:hypothetical protein
MQVLFFYCTRPFLCLFNIFLTLFNIFLTLQEVQVLVFLCARPLYILLNLFFTAAGSTNGGFFTVLCLYMSFQFSFLPSRRYNCRFFTAHGLHLIGRFFKLQYLLHPPKAPWAPSSRSPPRQYVLDSTTYCTSTTVVCNLNL